MRCRGPAQGEVHKARGILCTLGRFEVINGGASRVIRLRSGSTGCAGDSLRDTTQRRNPLRCCRWIVVKGEEKRMLGPAHISSSNAVRR